MMANGDLMHWTNMVVTHLLWLLLTNQHQSGVPLVTVETISTC